MMEDSDSNNDVYNHSTLVYRLSQVNDFFNKDRIRPGTELTIKGYIMTPSYDKIDGENHAELVIYSYTDLWNISTSEVINKNYSPDVWHPFEVSTVVPEHRQWPNTSSVPLYQPPLPLSTKCVIVPVGVHISKHSSKSTVSIEVSFISFHDKKIFLLPDVASRSEGSHISWEKYLFMVIIKKNNRIFLTIIQLRKNCKCYLAQMMINAVQPEEN